MSAGSNKSILIVTQGHALKSLINGLLAGQAQEATVKEIPHAKPIVLEIDRNDGNKIVKSYYIEDYGTSFDVNSDPLGIVDKSGK